MQVRMKVKISGTRNGEEWPDKGEVIDLPDDEAVQLLGQGAAEPADEPEPETATKPKRARGAKADDGDAES